MNWVVSGWRRLLDIVRRPINRRPSELPGLAAYPAVQHMFQTHLDMQFDDLRSMLRLPTRLQRGGCNFAAAALLMNLISGFSVVLYNDPDPGMPPATDRRRRGDRLRHLLVDLLPHDPAVDPPRQIIADVLYTFARNSLTHALGLRQPALEPEITIAKRRLTSADIAILESSAVRPGGLVTSVVTQTAGGGYVISVAGLYWATFRLLEVLVAAPNHMALAQRELNAGTWVP
jgi:hypothetical protein